MQLMQSYFVLGCESWLDEHSCVTAVSLVTSLAADLAQSSASQKGASLKLMLTSIFTYTYFIQVALGPH